MRIRLRSCSWCCRIRSSRSYRAMKVELSSLNRYRNRHCLRSNKLRCSCRSWSSSCSSGSWIPSRNHTRPIRCCSCRRIQQNGSRAWRWMIHLRRCCICWQRWTPSIRRMLNCWSNLHSISYLYWNLEKKFRSRWTGRSGWRSLDLPSRTLYPLMMWCTKVRQIIWVTSTSSRSIRRHSFPWRRIRRTGTNATPPRRSSWSAFKRLLRSWTSINDNYSTNCCRIKPYWPLNRCLEAHGSRISPRYFNDMHRNFPTCMRKVNKAVA